MFDLHSALAQLQQRELGWDELNQALQTIRRDHLGEIPPDIGVAELLILAKQRKWISEDENGRFHINIAEAA